MPRTRSIVASCVLLAAIAVAAPATAHPKNTSGPADVRVRDAGRPDRSSAAPRSAHDGSGPAASWPRPARAVPSGTVARTGIRTPTTDGLDADLLGNDVALSPADPTGATGPTRVVAAVNVAVAVYDRTGAQLLAPLRLRQISSTLAGTQETDPKVFYDGYSDVFVLAFLTYTSSQGYINVVTIPSATAEDTGTWCMTHMVGDQFRNGKHEFADYPSIGFTSDTVTLTTNNFGFNNGPFRYAQIISMPKTQLYDDPTCTKTVHIEVAGGAKTRNPDGSKAFTLQAATSGSSPSGSQYLASLETRATETKLVLWRVRVGSGRMTILKVARPVARASLPPYGYQCGSTDHANTWWDTGDLRLTSAFYDGVTNHLYAATAVGGNAGGGPSESVIRWYEASTKSKFHRSTVTREGTIKAPDHDAAWPAVATNDGGTLFVTYARAGVSDCLGIWAATVPAGSTTATAALVRAGELRYEFGPGVERWGDFSAANPDPLTPADVAVFGAFAEDTGGATTDVFREHVALLADT